MRVPASTSPNYSCSRKSMKTVSRLGDLPADELIAALSPQVPLHVLRRTVGVPDRPFTGPVCLEGRRKKIGVVRSTFKSYVCCVMSSSLYDTHLQMATGRPEAAHLADLLQDLNHFPAQEQAPSLPLRRRPRGPATEPVDFLD